MLYTQRRPDSRNDGMGGSTCKECATATLCTLHTWFVDSSQSFQSEKSFIHPLHSHSTHPTLFYLILYQHTHVHTPEKSSFQPLNLTILYISIVCMCSTLWQQQPDLSSRLQITKVDLISIMSKQQQNQIFIKCRFLPNCDEM